MKGRGAVQTEEIFRSANDRIGEKAHELGWRFPVPFLCECDDRRCFARVDLTVDSYDEMRVHPQRYLTAPGHGIEGAFLLEQTESAALVEKLYAER